MLYQQIYLATRNEQGTKEAMEKLKMEGLGDGSLHWLKLDLEDPHSAKSAAEEFLKKEERLDILSMSDFAPVIPLSTQRS